MAALFVVAVLTLRSPPARPWARPSLDPAVQHVTPVLATHDEEEQFRAGLDLLIAGLRAQR